MLARIAAFEFRYQLKNPVLWVAATLFFLAALGDMAVAKIVSNAGGNVLFNSPHAIIVSHLLLSLIFLFVGAAFVSNAVVRDDHSGYGPIVRSTRVTKFDYLFGRFIGAFGIAALVMAAVPFGAWLGTLMPFADQAMLGPNRLSAFAYGYGFFALPNALIISAILFALATITRSTAGTFFGVVGFIVVYLLSQRLMEGQPQLLNIRVLADPLGMSAYMASSRYFTAAELNAGVVPVTDLMLQSRLLWIGASIVLLALTYRLFRFSDRGVSPRRQRKLRRQAAMATLPASGQGPLFPRLPEPRFDSRTARAQFIARAGHEARYIFKSPVFLILLVIAFAFTLPSLLTASGRFGVPLYPLTFLSIPIIEASFDAILIIIAAYYGGELVWRERERKIHEIIDATPLPAWTMMLPKMLGLALVLFATLLVGLGVGLLVQVLKGGVSPAPVEYLIWYLLPGSVDAALIAALAVFVQALSPGKYAGWGVMVLYIALLFFGPSLGLTHPLLLYGNVPAVPLSDMTGTGNFWTAAGWFRLFWAAAAALLLVAAHLLWRRGTEQRLKPRLRQLPKQLTGLTRLVAVSATALLALSGGWIVYNTLVLNDYRTGDTERYLAEYERRFFRYATLPQPVVRHVELDVALHPEAIRAEVRGRYRLVNETGAPIEQIHVRLLNRDLGFIALDLPGSRLERNDEDFGYRVYRLDTPMRPGEIRELAFRTRREQVGFRASGTETSITPRATDLDSIELTPRIGMSDVGLIEEPAVRHRYGLPERQPFPRLGDLAATRVLPGGDVSWTTADITVSTSADQTPIAPGRKVSERIENGRRIVRFVSDAPIRNYFSIQSGRYAVRTQSHGGVQHSIYFHPEHGWNVDRMMTAMQVSIDYFRSAFGPYQFDQARIIETPAYRDGGQAFANTVPVGETAAFVMDLRNPDTIDMATVMAAHELSHQWWGQQVVGARMQGAALLHETLAQYSALMVMKRLHGEEQIHRLLQFQLDRYLSGRRANVLAEEPLVSVGMNQQHIAYGKGALAMYFLQHRMGEDRVNRALRRFVERYRFTVAPYPRSVDLIAFFRAEARTPADHALITDLFERITLYDLRVEQPTAARRPDGRWTVTVPVDARKIYADGQGNEREVMLNEPIEIALFTDGQGSGAPDRNLVAMELRPIRTGRQVLRFITARRPTRAVVDPYNFYIDRNSGDNIAPVMD